MSHFAPRVKIYFSWDEPIVIYKHDTERGNPPQKGWYLKSNELRLTGQTEFSMKIKGKKL